MPNRSLYICLLYAIIGLAACKSKSSYDADVQQTLDEAGENRIELTKVLTHYGTEKADSLKLDAALYLIKNMRYHTATYSEQNFYDTFKKCALYTGLDKFPVLCNNS